MRINKYIAAASGLSRRKADELIARGDITVNGHRPSRGQDIGDSDEVKLGSTTLYLPAAKTTIMFNKPVGYVVSRDGQGSRTIYELLPAEYQQLKPVGRLDKNSSGLLLLTNDGDLAQELTHPSHQKTKVYEVTLYKPLTDEDTTKINRGVMLEDGMSKLDLKVKSQNSNQPVMYEITMHEGRNRQIRRTFLALRYEVKTLHRTHFGEHQLANLPAGLTTHI